MANSTLQELLNKYVQDSLSPEEIPVLQELIQQETHSGELDQWLQEAYANPAWAVDSDYDKDKVFADLQARLTKNPATVVDFRPSGRNRLFRRIAVAASVLMVIATGAYFMFFDRKGSDVSGPVVTTEPAQDIKAPETNRAMVTLSDGRTVPLDSLSNGLLAQQGNVQLVKLADGQIAYQSASGEITTEIEYNTLSNPRGSKVIDMQLSDGSHIWLNAGSSVTYPVAFAGNDRKVAITGEAYFEVAHDAAKPFYVTKGDLEVRVLGTHFNVNAYDNEGDIKITLLEGSVRVSAGGKSALIQPNQQAIVKEGNVAINKTMDVDQVMAWKNGMFVFDGYAGIDAIMRQVERWYDVKVVYAGNVNTLFGGSVPRSANVSRVLKMLEATGKVTFKLEDGTITVTPVK